MSDIFFEQLELPTPDYRLSLTGQTPVQHIAEIMPAFERIALAEKPDVVIVFGDVNPALACALVASRLKIRLVHVEAGLRSGDNSMPEEINRRLIDVISEDLFVSEASGVRNLQMEGIPEDRIHWVGNCMIDTLVYYQEKAKMLKTPQKMGLKAGAYAIMTFHRPSNVDDYNGLLELTRLARSLAERMPVVFPLHPRTLDRLHKFDLLSGLNSASALQLTEPLGYLEFMDLHQHARLVVTDSGGVQEESTYLGIPCITFRNSTERPVTVELGSNRLVPRLEAGAVLDLVDNILDGKWQKGKIPPLWDGQAGKRIVEILLQKR